jgi:ABC-type multidrug transport system fused ATPase/permease subunit
VPTLADFSLGDLIISMIWLFGLIVFFWLLIIVFTDIFRSHDLGGFAKAMWVIFVIVLPFLGILIYLVARGDSMHERQLTSARQADAEMRQYIQQAAAGSSTADQLEKLSALHDAGKLTDAEFASEKAKLIS